MKVDEALRGVTRTREPARVAMTWALAHWEDASSRLVSRFKAFSSGRDRSVAARIEAFFTVHLCAEKRHTAIFAPLCGMIARDSSIARWLGDAVTETLPGILIRVFDGDVDPLKRAVESPAGDEFARASALSALAYLVRSKAALSDAQMVDYLRRILDGSRPRQDCIIWMAWAACAANLGYEELRPEVELLNEEGSIPGCDFTPDLFDERVELVSRDPSGLIGFHSDLLRPVESAIEAIESMRRAGCAGPETDGGFEEFAGF